MTANYLYPAIRPELPPPEQWAPYIEEAYRANWFTNFGVVSRRFERALSERWGFAETGCVCASSATSAIAAALIAAGAKGRVLIPAFTFPATLAAVRMAGCEPELIDVCPTRWSITPEELQAALEQTQAQAAVLVAPFGIVSDWSKHIEIAAQFGAKIVIDNAAGLGVERRNVEASAHVIECYSLHATKPFGIGEGGAIFANATREASLRAALNFGLPHLGAGGGPSWGINGKMSEFAAAVGLAVIETFDERLEKRRALAQRYIDRLADELGVQYCGQVRASAWQVFPVLMPSRMAAELAVGVAAEYGMEVRRYYRPSLSLLPDLPGFKCPASEDLAERMICFPVYSSRTDEEAAAMVRILMIAIDRGLKVQ